MLLYIQCGLYIFHTALIKLIKFLLTYPYLFNVAVSTANHIQPINSSIVVFIWAFIIKSSKCGRRRRPAKYGLILPTCLPVCLPAYIILVVLKASAAHSFLFFMFIAGRKTDRSQFLYVHKTAQIHKTYRPFMSHVGSNR